MKRMIRAAKQLGSQVAKRILDWVMQTGEVSTCKGMGKSPRHAELVSASKNQSAQSIIQPHHAELEKYIMLNPQMRHPELVSGSKSQVAKTQDPEQKKFTRLTSFIGSFSFFRMTYGRKIAAAVVLGVIITTAVVAKPYNCIPCKENNYCIKGIRYECPLDKPVTQGNRKTSEDDCMTCIQRNGDETNPVYDITRDDCVSCYEYSNGATPVWNGSACVACLNGGIYNVTTGECEATVAMSCNDNDFCTLTEDIPDTTYCKTGAIVINTAEKLAKIGTDADYKSGDFCVTNDIDLSAYGSNYNNGEGWIPIYISADFRFDGNNKKIKNLYINRVDPLTDYGLFSSISYNSFITNVILENVSVNVTGNTFPEGAAMSLFSGQLVGIERYYYLGSSVSKVTNCSVIGTVSGNVTKLVGTMFSSGCGSAFCAQ